MNTAALQVLLEGVPLPARRADLLRYALSHGAPPWTVASIMSLPDREFDSLDEVGEALAPVQPRTRMEVRSPRAESGEPPGGARYTNR
jgi:hypothetical protein